MGRALSLLKYLLRLLRYVVERQFDERGWAEYNLALFGNCASKAKTALSQPGSWRQCQDCERWHGEAVLHRD